MAGLVVDPRTLSWVLGAFLGILAVALLGPLGMALSDGPGAAVGLFESLLITLAASALLLLLGWRPQRPSLRDREAILLVVLIWLTVCAFGALPFYLSGHYHSYTDAFFESASGFTTTGATVLTNVDDLPSGLQLWRALSHWLGGMGIVVLGLAVLPLLAHGGAGLYRAEFSGAVSERLRPRITEIARSLWKIYLVLTAALFASLWAAGMTPFDALCHAFSTMGTGGFSTRTASIAAFSNPLIEYILILFMLLAGISFIQHYRLWIQRRPLVVVRDFEVRAFLLLITGASALIALQLMLQAGMAWEPAVRAALFQVVSISTTTGFVSADYAAWQPLAQLLLLLLMFVGGCTGSTAGGLKVARTVLLVRVVQREFRRIAEPQGVFRIRLGGAVVMEDTVNALLNLVYLAWIILLLASLVIAATGIDVLTALSAVVACQFNIGPGLGGVGPLENYGPLNDLAKWVLSFCMIAGRLEFYTLLVVFTGIFWRR
jgi:trk system potassium uptake protein